MAVLGATTLTGCNSIPDFLPSGTLVLYKQTTAPTSWTKQTTHDNKALRVVNGTASSGGTTAFTTVFTSRSVGGTVQDTTLATTQIPAHFHAGGSSSRDINGGPGVTVQTTETGNAGGGQAHSHSFSGTSQDFAVQYVDVIVASKN